MTTIGNEIFASAFIVLAFVLTFLMYYLWKFPYDKERHVSSAPRSLVSLHRVLGYVFVIIYVYLMADMIPRLWTYQVELPARTVAHLVLGIAIGALLLIKIVIVRFFKHMEAALVPMLGTGILICSVVLLGLALPTTLREAFLRDQALAGGNMAAEQLERVREQLPAAGITDPEKLESLATQESLFNGRDVLINKCVQCHDLRTILVKPRTPETWRRTVERMANRSVVLDPIDEREQLEVTAYLIAISPTLQRSTAQQRQESKQGQDAAQAISSMMKADDAATSLQSTFDLAAATSTFETTCSQCHSPVLVQANPPTSREEATMLVARMVRNGLQAGEADLEQVVGYLVTTFADEQASAASTETPQPQSVQADTPSDPTPAASTDSAQEEVDQEIVLRPMGELIEFETKEIRARAGTRLRVVLDNPSTSGIAHNFVLIREADAYDDVSTAGLAAADSGFVPEHEQVIAAIPELDSGGRASTVLTVPSAGRYRFGCMMPGHSFTMQGTLIVE